MRKPLLTYERQKGLYQSKVTSSLTFTQRQGHQAHNCKMDYSNGYFVNFDNPLPCQQMLYLLLLSLLITVPTQYPCFLGQKRKKTMMLIH